MTEAIITAAQLKAAMPRCEPARWVEPLNIAMRRYAITTPRRVAMLLATIAHESADLTRLEEDLNYSARRIHEVWPTRFPTVESAKPYEWQPQKLANRIYAGRMGNLLACDGWLFRGRGPAGLTGRGNYRACGLAIGYDIEAQPDLVLEPMVGALTAGWYWDSRGCSAAADRGDLEALTRAWNGGLTGLEDRRRRLALAEAALARGLAA